MSIFTGKKISIFLHTAAWLILFLLPIYLTSTSDRKIEAVFVVRIFVRTAIYILIFYLSYFWLIPKLLFQGKKVKYYLSIFIIIVALYFVNEFANWTLIKEVAKVESLRPADRPKPEPPDRRDGRHDRGKSEFRFLRRFDIYNYLLTSFLVSGFSVGLRMSGKYIENEKKRKELEKEKLSSELAFLKNQVGPHFFFNTLNNIYSLTEINTKEAQNAILQLSKLMRYLLYESEKGDIQLSSEIAFMKNYIDLMKLRLSDKVTLNYSFPDNYTDFTVPPLIFIPFIENAFKHGVSYREKSFIDIKLEVENKNLRFSCINSVFAKKDDMSGSGIGLENARKRLKLLFPNAHKLDIGQHDQVFEVLLVIQNV
jgi:hypothetical protein